MTRINVVPVQDLSGPHLCAEYRELPRVFGLAYNASQSRRPWTQDQPSAYTMGKGHVLFFYDKLMFLSDRHREIVKEMLARGYRPTQVTCLHEQWCHRIPAGYWRAYTPDAEAVAINQQRIDERNKFK